VPEEHLSLFEGEGPRFLLARKGWSAHRAGHRSHGKTRASASVRSTRSR
jgi:hypothetical protein